MTDQRPSGQPGYRPTAARRWPRLVGAGVVVLLALVPFLDLNTFGLLPGTSLSSSGSLLLLASAFAFAGASISYDIVFGVTGLLSLGHSLFFGAGAYAFAIAQETFHLSFTLSVVASIAFGTLLALAVGIPSLRVNGFAFAMVTLALATAGSVFVTQDPFGVTQGDVGITLSGEGLPGWLASIADSRNVYWIALGVVVAIFLISWWAVRSPAGRVWHAIRENEARVKVLGLPTQRYKLGAWVLAGGLASTAGVVYSIVYSGANIFVAAAECAIVIQIIVILGGVGSLWGSLVGAVIYTFVGTQLPNVISASSLPASLQGVLSQPLFLLGLLFIVCVLWAPGGFAGLVKGRRGGGGSSLG